MKADLVLKLIQALERADLLFSRQIKGNTRPWMARWPEINARKITLSESGNSRYQSFTSCMFTEIISASISKRGKIALFADGWSAIRTFRGNFRIASDTPTTKLRVESLRVNWKFGEIDRPSGPRGTGMPRVR
jgi:hypothetical protein